MTDDTIFATPRENFASLSLAEYSGTLNAVGLDNLAPKEAELLSLFLVYVESDLLNADAIDYDQLLWVRASADGIFQDVYTPSLKSNGEGGLVLQVGVNKFAVTVEDRELVCGGLSGSIAFGQTVKYGRSDGSEIEYQTGFVDFMVEGDDRLWRVKCAFDPEKDLKAAAIRRAEKEGDAAALSQFFKVAGGGDTRTDTFRMEEIGEGEFLVTGIRSVETKYGENFILTLSDNREVWSRGAVTTLLRSGWQSPKGLPLTLTISNIRPRGEGKFSIDCALRLRAPRDNETNEAGRASTAISCGYC